MQAEEPTGPARGQWRWAPKVIAMAMLSVMLAGCVVVPAGPYYARRPCCYYYHPARW